MPQMPNDAAAEKAGSTEHGDGATVRCRHDSNSSVYVGASHVLPRNPTTRSSNRSILPTDLLDHLAHDWTGARWL
jgi:hypothetical protein